MKFRSSRTDRGPLCEGWREDTQPIMCSYKLVDVRFDLSLLTHKVEEFVHKVNSEDRIDTELICDHDPRLSGRFSWWATDKPSPGLTSGSG